MAIWIFNFNLALKSWCPVEVWYECTRAASSPLSVMGLPSMPSYSSTEYNLYCIASLRCLWSKPNLQLGIKLPVPTAILCGGLLPYLLPMGPLLQDPGQSSMQCCCRMSLHQWLPDSRVCMAGIVYKHFVYEYVLWPPIEHVVLARV